MDQLDVFPRFEFGFGLSYTTFTYSSLSISLSGTTYHVSFTVANSGSLAGTEIPQLYLGYPSSADEPQKVLRGFDEVPLGAGERKTVTMLLDQRSMR
jgi:beta-glucosidase